MKKSNRSRHRSLTTPPPCVMFPYPAYSSLRLIRPRMPSEVAVLFTGIWLISRNESTYSWRNANHGYASQLGNHRSILSLSTTNLTFYNLSTNTGRCLKAEAVARPRQSSTTDLSIPGRQLSTAVSHRGCSIDVSSVDGGHGFVSCAKRILCVEDPAISNVAFLDCFKSSCATLRRHLLFLNP